MLENLTYLAIIITIFWLGAIGFYFYTSRQQSEIQDDLASLRAKLDELENKSD